MRELADDDELPAVEVVRQRAADQRGDQQRREFAQAEQADLERRAGEQATWSGIATYVMNEPKAETVCVDKRMRKSRDVRSGRRSIVQRRGLIMAIVSYSGRFWPTIKRSGLLIEPAGKGRVPTGEIQ